MYRVLVMGGTRFFGKRLVQVLLDDGAEVTIATRGHTDDSFGDTVERLIVDRENYESLAGAVKDREWDVIYDNICYSPQDALNACEIFAGKVKKYIYTSTMSVYESTSADKKEEEFDPTKLPIRLGSRNDFDYGTAKGLAEAVFAQRAPFPVCSVRFTYVLGEDDYTRRLEFHINRVKKGILIGIPDVNAKINFISSDEAADLLLWLKDRNIEGPLNACSTGAISLAEMISAIEQEVGKKAIIVQRTSQENMSPYGVERTFTMNNKKATQAGFAFQPLHSWFPVLLRHLVRS
ncbi:nucleoside-diphosphate-sugar epimerase [Paenibacillus sp. DS2015]|uniref:NAD-dependent epimerase/dehydratase family protein n=1 Tax=Paenibacillus sp. DS2015 TaxID=3373917 RepID=UPI003D1BB146